MLGYFPYFYPGEVLYSAIARYHKYSLSSGLRETFINVFNDRNMVASIEFQSHLEEFANNMNQFKSSNHDLISKEYLLNSHTLFPLYKPFLFKKEEAEISNMMFGKGGMGIKGKIGFIAGSICKKEHLAYCPQCLKEAMVKYGEGYFKSIHQMQGVMACAKHSVKLLAYPIKRSDVSRLSYIGLDEALVKNTFDLIEDTWVLEISRMFEEVANGKLNVLNAELLKALYLRRLDEMGLLSIGKEVKYPELTKLIYEVIGESSLQLFESTINADWEHEWIRRLLRTKKVKVHPLRHLILIKVIFGSMDGLIEFSKLPVVAETYPCLNPVGGHYREMVLTEKDAVITADFKTRVPVITLKCPNCGFTYSRKKANDIYKVGRVKEFGPIWFEEFRKVAHRTDLSLRAKARHMGCDAGTVKKYSGLECKKRD